MKYILAFLMASLSCFAFADTGALSNEEFGLLMTAINWVAGDYAVLTTVILFAIGFLWAQLRQFVSPETMAKLPKWLIIPLEFLAANKGHAQNELNKDPLRVKKER